MCNKTLTLKIVVTIGDHCLAYECLGKISTGLYVYNKGRIKFQVIFSIFLFSILVITT